MSSDAFGDVLALLLLLLVPIVGVALYFGYKLTKNYFGVSVAKRDLRSAVFTFTAVFSIVIVSFILIPHSWRELFFALFFALFVVGSSLLVWISAFRTTQQIRKTVVLLNLGRIEGFLFPVGLLWLGLGVIQLPDVLTGQDSSLLETVAVFAYFSFGCIFLARALTDVLVTEKGLILFAGLIQWQEINSFHWETDKNDVFSIKIKRRFTLFRELSFKVTEHSKQDVERVFSKVTPLRHR